jgi:hypothetical protein
MLAVAIMAVITKLKLINNIDIKYKKTMALRFELYHEIKSKDSLIIKPAAVP